MFFLLLYQLTLFQFHSVPPDNDAASPSDSAPPSLLPSQGAYSYLCVRYLANKADD
jgi:hypothetical protein